MATSIQCPHCLSELNIKDPALVGRKVRCPKCREVFRAGESLKPVAGDPDSAGFASFDFEEAPRPNVDAWPDAEAPLAAAPMWTAPVREVPIAPKGKPALSKGDAAKLKSRREYSLLMVGGSVCTVIALVVIVVGTLSVWRSMRKNAAETVVLDKPTASEAATTTSSGNLPTIFGFDESRRGLLVDYLVSQGNGKPKAKLTMAMVVNALKKLAADFNVQPSEELPEQLELLRERVIMRDVPEELLKSEKVPAVFQKMMVEYQEKTLGPAEEEVAILVIMAFLGAEM